MMEGPDPTASLASHRYDVLEKENKANADEIQRLRGLPAANNIPYESNPSKKPTIQPRRRATRQSSTAQPANKPLPHLPTEIQLRILSHVLTSPEPIIDPFYKLRRENVTKKEWGRNRINLQFLLTCKSFQVEGMRFIFANNEFIFTQSAALENFTKFSKDLRATMKHVTLRVVGRYYDQVAGRRDLTGNVDYHPQMDTLMMPIVARPSGMMKDKGIQAYCWEQVADFLKALQMPTPASISRPKLLPCLESMRLDLVNFCDHLPYGGYQFGSLVRWHLGQIVDELLVTGAPDPDQDDYFSNEEKLLHQLVRDEGLVGSATPIFVSVPGGLRPLKKYAITQQVIRADKPPSFKSAKKLIHPEGGEPPKSDYPAGRTIWKWTSDSLTKSTKQWIEFDRRSGLPADEIDDWSDMWSDASIDF
jgi:hypothetical protein